LKSVVLARIGKFEIEEDLKPHLLNDDEVLLKIDTVGVCGSDIHYYKEGNIGDQVVEFPFTIGHECSAIVEAVGNKVIRVKPGDLVAIEPTVSCGKCSQCLAGRAHTCLDQKCLGCPGQIEGCLSEYIIMPERNCYPIPLDINGEIAALVEPLSIGYYAASFLSNKENINSIAILGVGPIGLGVLLSLQTFEHTKIYVTDKVNYRLETAKKAGAVWAGNPNKEDIVASLNKIDPDGFDVVFECCGKQEAIDNAIEILKPGGTLLIIGIPEIERISFDISKIRRKEITIQNVRRQNRSIQPVIDLIVSGKLSPEFMITHRFSFEKTGDAFDIVANYRDNVIKAVIRF
jgi:L-iditol 2-dehydrogenase